MASARRWRLVLVGWLVAVGAVIGLGFSAAGEFEDSGSIPGSPAQTALLKMDRHFPSPDLQSAQVVFQAPEGLRLEERRASKALETSLAAMAEVNGVREVGDPAGERLVSPDGRTAVAEVTFSTVAEEDVPPQMLEAVRAAGEQAERAGLKVVYGGEAFTESTPAVGPAELVGLGVALVILIITFGSLLAAGLPLLTAVLGVVGTMAAVMGAATVFGVSDNAPTLAVMLGLAVGIDYALFVVSRHRAQLGTGMPVVESVGRANATAGSAVVFAGATVIIALAGLSVAGVPMLTSMGLASAASVAAAVVLALGLLPALLGMAGSRLTPKARRRSDEGRADASRPSADRRGVLARLGRRRAVRRPAAARRGLFPRGLFRRGAGSGARGERAQASAGRVPLGVRWTEAVLRRPVRSLVLGTLVVIGLALPAVELKLAVTDEGNAPAMSSSRQAYDLISEAFGPGANGPLVVLVEDSDRKTVESAATEVADKLATVGGIADVSEVDVAEDERAARIQIIPETGPRTEETSALVSKLRTELRPLASASGSYIAVTGLTAVSIDVADKLGGALVPFGIVVVGFSLILLMVAFRSLAIPVKATLGFLLSLGAAFGATVAVFQWGWMAGPLGIDSTGPVASFMPIIVMAVLFGLAMDYEVFLVSAMREDYVQHGRPRQAILTGARNAVRVVTAAALIMISVFISFLFSHDADTMAIAFALAFGVLVDAFLVRMTLVPAAMALLGHKAWRLPRVLDRILPHLDIEGENLTTPQAPVPDAPKAPAHANT
ncbi:MMPL family transporter [Streptomyces sp. NPDC003832]